jgi:hypothetical protein
MPFLKEFVYRAGIGLENEDRSIIGSSIIHNRIGGILISPQEMFFQYIIWKSVYNVWNIGVERNFFGNQYDFVKFIDNGNKVCDCYFELKKWFTPQGEQEIPGICEDIRRLIIDEINNSVFILVSANERGQMMKQIKWLSTRVFNSCGFKLPNDQMESFCFDTISPFVENHSEFWIAAWPIKIENGGLLQAENQ